MSQPRTPLKLLKTLLFLLAAVVLSGTAFSQQSASPAISDLSHWAGEWRSAYSFVAEEEAHELFHEVAHATGQDEAAIEAAVSEMFFTSFADAAITADRIVFDGSLVCDYGFAGLIEATYGDASFWWASFETASNGCDEYATVIVTEPHGEGTAAHYHLRYGSASGAQLADDATHGAWYPALFPAALDLGDFISASTNELAAFFGGQPHDHDHDHDHGSDPGADHASGHAHMAGSASELQGVRLLVGDVDAPRVVVLDAATGQVVGSFTTPGIGAVQQMADTQYAAVTHGAENRVTFIHSGLTTVDHGDHADLLLGQPYVLATINTGLKPAHFASNGHDVVIFNDGDGTVALLDARLIGASIDYDVVDGGQPDHGAAVTFGEHLAVGLITPGTVEVFGRSGASLARFEGCDRLHGQGTLNGRAVFGCTNGVLVVWQANGVFRAQLLPNPAGSPEGARVSTLVSRNATDVLVGNFGEGFAVIDPVALTFSTYAAAGTQVGGVLFEDGTRFARLGSDGTVRVFDLASGSELGALPVVPAVETGAPRPSITSYGELAFITNPVEKELMIVDLHEVEEFGHMHLSFAPNGVALFAIPGAVLH